MEDISCQDVQFDDELMCAAIFAGRLASGQVDCSANKSERSRKLGRSAAVGSYASVEATFVHGFAHCLSPAVLVEVSEKKLAATGVHWYSISRWALRWRWYQAVGRANSNY